MSAQGGDAHGVAGDGMPSNHARILVVDDEPEVLASLKELFEASLDGVEVMTAASAAEGLAILARSDVDLIVTDYKLPGMDGLDFLAEARASAPNVPRILVTAFPDLQVALRAINEAGIESFFTKPFEPAQVVGVVRAVLDERRTQALRSRSFARSLDVLRRRLANP